MAEQGNILKEALQEAKALKEAAIRNAENSLVGHFREVLEETVSAELNEESDMDAGDELDEEGDDDTMAETMEHDPYGDTMSEMFDDEDLELSEDDLDEDEEGGDDLDELEEAAGFSETDLTEAIQQALMEVDHGDLGEMDELDPDSHPTGLMDQDSKEAGWDDKDAPHKKDWTVKESKYRRKISKLVSENAALKKGMAKLREAVQETNLFNRKMYFAHKILSKPGLTEGMKRKVVKRIDAARNMVEVQNIYESLEMALGVLSEGAKKKSKKATTLSEALGSQPRSERGISNIEDAHLLNEDARFSSRRMKVLAGLIKEDL